MSDVNTDPVVVNTDPTVVPGTEPSGAPVSNPDRDALIAKYEAQYGQPVEATTDPITEQPVVTETAAQADPNAVLQAVMAELTAIKSQLAPKTQPAVEQTQEDWLKLLAEGKKSEGEKALAALLGPQIQQQAVQQAIQQITMERELDAFANKVRAENADILPMETYIAQAANNRIQAAQAAGSIKSPADYVTVYKQAITAEIENARKLAQTLRGAGKEEAITRQTQVLSSPTLKPNAVNMQREAPKVGSEPQVETTADYMAKRQAMHARISGLSS